MSVIHTISRPYARAIFEFAIQHNSLQKWKEDLIFINTVATYKKVNNFLSNSLSSKFLSSFFIEVGSGIISRNTENLIKLLAKNQRFKILDAILEHFFKLEASYNKIIVVELISAFSLKQTQILKLRKILESIFLKKIKFLHKIDENILDGMIIKIDDKIFNFSVQNRLKKLSDALIFLREE